MEEQHYADQQLTAALVRLSSLQDRRDEVTFILAELGGVDAELEQDLADVDAEIATMEQIVGEHQDTYQIAADALR